MSKNKTENEAAEAQATEAVEVQTAPKHPAKVKVKLSLTRTEKDDVFVGLNGKNYLIKRGVEVEVPWGVAKILKRREKMLMDAMEFEDKAAAPLEEMAKM